MNTKLLGLGLVATVAVAGCGKIQDSKFVGQPLAKITAVTSGATRNDVENPRAALWWFEFDVECLAANELGCQGMFGTSLEDTPINPEFPSTFSISLYDPPPTSELNEVTGGYLGAAPVLVYDDLNEDDELDTMSMTDVGTPPDAFLGSSFMYAADIDRYTADGDVPDSQYVIYSEGDIDDAFEKWQFGFFFVNAEAFNATSTELCPTPPEGYSAVEFGFHLPEDWIPADFDTFRIDSMYCHIISLEDIDVRLMEPLDAEAFAPNSICVGWPVDMNRPVYPDAEPSETAEVDCWSTGMGYTLYEHPDSYCRPYSEVALVDSYFNEWDLSSTPPEWWPCPIP